MTHSILEQEKSGVNGKLYNARRYDGRRLRSADLEDALKARGVTAGERRIVEFLIPLLEGGPLRISQRQIKAGAHVEFESIQRGLKRAVDDHAFLLVDKSTRPHTYSIPEEWFTHAAVRRGRP